MRRIVFILLLIFTSIQIFGQLNLLTRIDKDSIKIGEQLEYNLILNSTNAIHSFVTDTRGIENSGLEIINAQFDSIFENDQFIYRQNYILTVFDSGEFFLPSLPVLVNDNKGLDTLYTDEFTLIVYSPEIDTTKEIMDIKGPVKTPFNLSEILPYIPWIAGALALIIAILVFMWYLRRKKKVVEEEENIPAHIKALIKLDKIKETKLWQQGKVKDYYVELSNTVRTYIEDRYEIPAMESVTWEILERFRKYSYDDDLQVEILDGLLNLSDLVKFAKENPEASENETHLSQAYIFVEKTKVVEIPKTEDIQDETEIEKQNI